MQFLRGIGLRGRRYAIIIDEAHSSQGGRTAAQMSMALSNIGAAKTETSDEIIARVIKQRKMIDSASYFGFTATPKGRTLELFGTPMNSGQREAFDTYTMKQAIQEGFIMDVLQNYTSVESYFQLAKAIEEDPAFDKDKAMKRLSHSEDSLSTTLAGKLSIRRLVEANREMNNKGHVDITIKILSTSRKRLGEAKIYTGYAKYEPGIEQLVGRYSTGRECTGYMFCYVKNPDIK